MTICNKGNTALQNQRMFCFCFHHHTCHTCILLNMNQHDKCRMDVLRQRFERRESRQEDVELIAALRSQLTDLSRLYQRTMENLEQQKLELLNREENFNKTFARQPVVGVMHVIKGKGGRAKGNGELGMRRSNSSTTKRTWHAHSLANASVHGSTNSYISRSGSGSVNSNIGGSVTSPDATKLSHAALASSMTQLSGAGSNSNMHKSRTSTTFQNSASRSLKHSGKRRVPSGAHRHRGSAGSTDSTTTAVTSYVSNR